MRTPRKNLKNSAPESIVSPAGKPSLLEAQPGNIIKAFWNQVDFRWMAFLLLLVGAHEILPQFGVYLEEVQMLFFPLVLVGFWRLPRKRIYRLPTALVVFAILLWGVASLHYRGALGELNGSKYVYASKLKDDVGGDRVEDLYQGYNRIARIYGLPLLKHLARSFESPEAGFEWLEDRSSALLLAIGHVDWMKVLVPPHQPVFRLAPFSEMPSPPEEFIQQARELGLSAEDDISYVYAPDLSLGLALVRSPEWFQLSANPPGLSRHYLSHLANAFRGDVDVRPEWEMKGMSKEDLLVFARREAFALVSQFEGNWPSPGPLGVARFFVGTLDVASFFYGDSPQIAELWCAQKALRSAAGFAFFKTEYETAAAIFNNAAVARILAGDSQRDFQGAATWLTKVLEEANRTGRPVRSTRAALLNLMMLKRSGLV